MPRKQIIVISCLIVAWGCMPVHEDTATQSRKVDQALEAPVAESRKDVLGNSMGGPATSSVTLPAGIAATIGDDALAEALAMNSPEHPLPPAEFEKGEVTPRDFDMAAISTDQRGFTIRMPSETPVPTPTIHQGRLYASGGFSSQEFYCFDADTGAFLWGVDLSDDGPSVAVPSGDDIIFNSESCTIFALDAATGELRWAHYMGDPMMSAPTVADGLVFTVYPARAEPPDDPEMLGGNSDEDEGDAAAHPENSTAEPAGLRPAYNLACLDARTGELRWRRWLDSDCITAPVAVDGELFVVTLPGTLYRLRLDNGTILSVYHARATSAPVITSTKIFFTRRTDDPEQEEPPSEAIVGVDRDRETLTLLARHTVAPYLDRVIQEASEATQKAMEAEAKNGIMGGFGGGFGGGHGGGFFSIPDEQQWDSLPDRSSSEHPQEAIEAESLLPTEELAPSRDVRQEPELVEFDERLLSQTNSPEEMQNQPLDLLAIQQQQAADNVGLGNVSTLQAYHGSRLVYFQDRNYNCMGDELVCTSAESGEELWSLALDGDLEALGGHLAAPPVLAEEGLFVATVVGQVLQVDPSDGQVRRRYEIGSELRYPPVVHDGRLYVSTQDGKIVCIRITDEEDDHDR